MPFDESRVSAEEKTAASAGGVEDSEFSDFVGVLATGQ